MGVEEITSCVGGEEINKYDPTEFYSQQQIDAYIREILVGRMEHTEQVAGEGDGLYPEIIRLAEKACGVEKARSRPKIFASAGGGNNSPLPSSRTGFGGSRLPRGRR